MNSRKRLRDLGIKIGKFKPGRYNAITDVKGVKVGHSTIIQNPGGDLKKAIRTGVTAILPNDDNIFYHRLPGGSFVLNGAGELNGITQVNEWGMIETPILLTNTLSVGTCSEATVNYMTEKYPTIGLEHDVIIPLVGECDDSWLNDIRTRSINHTHVLDAINTASSGPVQEGNVGGGTGMITCDFKGGIGTSSRKINLPYGQYTVGILVMSNFGERNELRIDGLDVGRLLELKYTDQPTRRDNYGSIIAVLATDAPVLPHQIARLCKRVGLGIGRAGSIAAHGSGEIVLGFSTGNTIPRESSKGLYKMKILQDTCINPFYQAAVEATEEAIINALCAGEDMEGLDGHYCPALPLDDVKKIFKKYRKDFYEGQNL